MTEREKLTQEIFDKKLCLTYSQVEKVVDLIILDRERIILPLKIRIMELDNYTKKVVFALERSGATHGE